MTKTSCVNNLQVKVTDLNEYSDDPIFGIDETWVREKKSNLDFVNSSLSSQNSHEYQYFSDKIILPLNAETAISIMKS